LVHHAYFKIGDKQEAEDIVQEVIVKMYLERKHFKGLNNPISYLYKMVSNTCIDHQRKNKQIEFTPVEISTEAYGKHSQNTQPSFIEDEFERVNKLLTRIPSEQSEVIRLKVIDEFSFVEIAKLFEIPVTTVKSRFKYGIDKLKKIYLTQKEVRYEL
jgi:RNA polymerase sigma-70 factor (ECF subfamily)